LATARNTELSAENVGVGFGRTRGDAEAFPDLLVGTARRDQLHDLPLIIFGLVLAGRGWLITYLGPDTPIETIQETLAADPGPRLVVISAATKTRLRAAQPQLAELVRQVPVALAGAGATDAVARAVGAFLLNGDPVTAAERVADEGR